jgi:carbon storage regulator CsrA
MLVLSRKKNESILIDSLLRIDVVSVAKATVRVRLMAPKSLQTLPGNTRKEARTREDLAAKGSSVGVDVRLLTLVNQQVVCLSESISLGVVDADKSRALFFVDAPAETSIAALDPESPGGKGTGARQNLLQFMGQGTDTSDDDPPELEAETEPVRDETADGETGPDLLPFPSPVSRRRRI